MALLLDVRRDKSGTMRRRRLTALRVVLIERIDASIYRSTEKERHHGQASFDARAAWTHSIESHCHDSPENLRSYR